MSSPERMSGLQIAAAIRDGALTAREAVEAHIAVIERVNPQLNALVAERFELAREEAARADERVAAARPGEQLPPLLGVPCTIKESLSLEGMPHSVGVVARREVAAERDGTATARLRAAGAIPLGVTNISELTLWIESDNRVYGLTNNPYDVRRTAGGSSGGEGAAIGAGAAPIGLGSDLAGSIRIPAFCCGIFGHRPSLGLVPITGIWPEATGAAGRMAVAGPMARRAEDLIVMLRAIAGPDGEDPLTTEMELRDPASVPLAGLRVVISERAFIQRIHPELLAARERAAEALAAAGARVERAAMPRLRRALEAFLVLLSHDVGTTAEEILASAGVERVAWRSMVRRGSPHTVPTRLMLAAERAFHRVPPGRARRMIAAAAAIGEELAEAVGDGVLLHPPLAAPAPRHSRTIGRPWWVHTMVPFNLAGMPATQVPLGLGSAGLPLGVQVGARHGSDHVAIAVALELERAFGGWVPPPALAAQSSQGASKR